MDIAPSKKRREDVLIPQPDQPNQSKRTMRYGMNIARLSKVAAKRARPVTTLKP